MGHRQERRRGQGGFVLLEAVISVVVAGTLVLATVAGLLVAVSMNRRNTEATGVDAAIVGVTERLRTMPYVPCASAAQIQARYLSSYPQRYLPAGTALEVRSVRHGTTNGGFSAIGATCTRDAGTQLVALQVRVGEQVADAEVVVRDAAARPS